MNDYATHEDSRSIGYLRVALRQFVAECDWDQFHFPSNPAMAHNVEAAERLEDFRWLTPQESDQLLAVASTKVRL